LVEPTVQAGASASRLDSSPCQECGACCAYSSAWPRFSLEDDVTLARIPSRYVAVSGNGMRCAGDRCEALSGEIGIATACRIYEARPDVCRACMPGDDACTMAREKFGLRALTM
jgi:uncharacterized protein